MSGSVFTMSSGQSSTTLNETKDTKDAQNQPVVKSKIPMPALRRSFSLRLRGEKNNLNNSTATSQLVSKYPPFYNYDDSLESLRDVNATLDVQKNRVASSHNLTPITRTPPKTPTTPATPNSTDKLPSTSTTRLRRGVSCLDVASVAVLRRQQQTRAAPAAQHSTYIQGFQGNTGGGGGGGGGFGAIASAQNSDSSRRHCNQMSGSNSSVGGGRLPAAQCNRLQQQQVQDESSRTRSLSLSLPSTAKPRSPRSPHQLAGTNTNGRRTPSLPSPYDHQNRTSTNTSTDWDSESVLSGLSGISLASTTCDHASVARNGTTFSGRSMKYEFHCNQHAGQTGEDYLTPTQRAHRQVKRLKALLRQAHANLEQKDSDIVKLTKEVVELRLYKAALSSPEDKSNSSDVDVVTVRENEDSVADGYEGISNAITNILSNGDIVEENSIHGAHYTDMNSSYTDSGHYDDYTCSSVHSKDSVLLGDDFGQSPIKQRKQLELVDKSTSVDPCSPTSDIEAIHKELVGEYERRLQELVKSHENDQHDLRHQHTTKVEELLRRITEINARYWELVPELDSARERIKELEEKLDEAMKKLEEQEEKHKATFLEMYNQGHEAAKLQQETQIMEIAQRSPSRISVSELLHQLQVTQTELENIKDVEYATTSNNKQPLLSAKEAVSLWVLGARKAMYRQLTEAKSAKNKIDPEITLQFLKSAIYYFLTDRENNQGHLRAIQSILGFTASEISNIEKARTT